MPSSLSLAAATSLELKLIESLLANPESVRVAQARLVTGEFEFRPVTLIQTGVGSRSVREALEEASERVGIERLLLIGVCGGVDPQLQTGDTVFPARVQDAQGNYGLDVHRSAWAWLASVLKSAPRQVYQQGICVTAASLLGPQEKQRIFRRNPEALIVDMEALELARFAEERKIPWAVLKTVADPADFEFAAEPEKFEQLLSEAAKANALLALRVFESLYPPIRPQIKNPRLCS